MYTSAYILVQLNSVQDVAQAECGQERMDALQEACGRVKSSIFQLEKLSHHFHPLKNPNIHGGMIALTFAVVVYSRASWDATWVELE